MIICVQQINCKKKKKKEADLTDWRRFGMQFKFLNRLEDQRRIFKTLLPECVLLKLACSYVQLKVVFLWAVGGWGQISRLSLGQIKHTDLRAHRHHDQTSRRIISSQTQTHYCKCHLSVWLQVGIKLQNMFQMILAHSPETEADSARRKDAL